MTSDIILRVAQKMSSHSKARVPGLQFLARVRMDGEEDFLTLARIAVEEVKRVEDGAALADSKDG